MIVVVTFLSTYPNARKKRRENSRVKYVKLNPNKERETTSKKKKKQRPIVVIVPLQPLIA